MQTTLEIGLQPVAAHVRLMIYDVSEHTTSPPCYRLIGASKPEGQVAKCPFYIFLDSHVMGYTNNAFPAELDF